MKLTEEQFAWLEKVSSNIATQDNRSTADPFFVVFQKREIVTDDEYDHDRIAWYDSESNEEADERTARRLEALDNRGRSVPSKWTRLAIKRVNEFVTACFTEQGCIDYLAVNGHNLASPFIYATSLFRNREMLNIREWLQNTSQPIAAPQQEWISVDAALPEERAEPYQVVVVCTKKYGGMYKDRGVRRYLQDWVVRRWPQNFTHWKEAEAIPKDES